MLRVIISTTLIVSVLSAQQKTHHKKDLFQGRDIPGEFIDMAGNEVLRSLSNIGNRIDNSLDLSGRQAKAKREKIAEEKLRAEAKLELLKQMNGDDNISTVSHKKESKNHINIIELSEK